jgi:hypothetical protein
LEKDLKMTGYDYNILLTMFSVSYILFEIPANIITKIVGPGKTIPIMVSATFFLSAPGASS